MSVNLVRILLDYLARRDIEVQNVLTELIYELYEKYCENKDSNTLAAAKDFVMIYDKIGLQREERDDIFEVIKKEYEQYAVIKELSGKLPSEQVTANKVQIRRLLGRWNSRAHSMPIDCVINDILKKVRFRQCGLYTYWTEHKMGKERKRFEYKLLVNKDDILFLDSYPEMVYRLDCGGGKR